MQVPDEKQNRINLESRNVYVNLLGVFLGLDLDLRRALFTVTVHAVTIHGYCSQALFIYDFGNQCKKNPCGTQLGLLRN